MLPTCPHCQKKLPVLSLLNARNLTTCPHCQKAISPKLNLAKGIGVAVAVLLIVTTILFAVTGSTQVTSIGGGLIAWLSFMIFAYTFEKKD
ncbi:hypothetical protein [Glaesserella sp.]|uniref:hypothetical protein n=1 Tax=Glaesserella sp. TaxID=2094731 RepID=UPI00359FC3BC